MAVLSKLVNALSPKSKNWLFNVSRGSINDQMTQLTLAAIVQIIVFFEQPDILYCKPECIETVYCRKDSKGEKLYKPKRLSVVEIAWNTNSVQFWREFYTDLLYAT